MVRCVGLGSVPVHILPANMEPKFEMTASSLTSTQTTRWYRRRGQYLHCKIMKTSSPHCSEGFLGFLPISFELVEVRFKMWSIIFLISLADWFGWRGFTGRKFSVGEMESTHCKFSTIAGQSKSGEKKSTIYSS